MSIEQHTTVIFHGRLADVFGRSLQVGAPPGCSIAELRSRIATGHPHAAEAIQSGRVRACVGDSIVHDEHRICPGEEVEFLPPVSGG